MFYGGYAIINRQIVSVCGVKSLIFGVAVKVHFYCNFFISPVSGGLFAVYPLCL